MAIWAESLSLAVPFQNLKLFQFYCHHSFTFFCAVYEFFFVGWGSRGVKRKKNPGVS